LLLLATEGMANHSQVIASRRSAAQKTLRSNGMIDPGESRVMPARPDGAASQAPESRFQPRFSGVVGHPGTTAALCDTRRQLATIDQVSHSPINATMI
jgi:hypothetical protein